AGSSAPVSVAELCAGFLATVLFGMVLSLPRTGAAYSQPALGSLSESTQAHRREWAGSTSPPRGGSIGAAAVEVGDRRGRRAGRRHLRRRLRVRPLHRGTGPRPACAEP